jgi:hypothetical protein
MAAVEPQQIEWDSAQIEDATLTVELTGSASKAWKARFESVLALLDTPHSSWGEVHLTRKGIKVADLQQGSESELRHFLESIVLQVNSDTAPDTPQHDDDSDEDREPDRDKQMTATFRAFAADHHSATGAGTFQPAGKR